MVKADLSRDYYGDLELAPTADVAEIKKQFKKLALTYHPDRNPGRENEVTAKFQKIQSAHEVLIDPTERAKYDANRIRGSSSSFRSSHTGTGGQASGVRGNPWANAGAGWAPPPKPPTARNRAQPPPPPSSGARRYDKFTPPQASAYQAAQEGPQARKAQYEAWENTRHSRGEHGPGKTWTAPKPPPRGTPQSGREESNAQSHAAPPKPRPGFDEFRDPSSSHSRSQSTNPTPSRKGFMPNMSGGDEPPAPRGNYSTQRDKPSVAPEPPPRQPPQPAQRTATGRTDPLKKFRDPDPPTSTEPRVSTPYATHGGEKFNPFESAFPSAANINRSKSTRERGEVDKDTFPAFRAGSDTNLNSKNSSPQRARSFAARSQHAPRPSYSESVNLDSSSDEEIVMNKSTARASARRSNGATPRPTKQPTGSTTDPETKPTSKQSKIQQLRQWMKENPGQEPPPNGFGADGPPLRSGQPTPKANGEPSMYASPVPSTPCNRPNPTAFDKRHPSRYSVNLEAVSENISSTSRAPSYQNGSVQYPELNKAELETPPSGVPTSPNSLNAFEEMQRSYVDRLLSNKRQASLSGSSETQNGKALKTEAGSQPQKSMNGDHKDNWTTYRDPTSEAESPAKKFKTLKHLQATHAYDFSKCKSFWDHHTKMKEEANRRNSSFSFNLGDETFAQTTPKTNGFSNSAENISTKFTPEDWDGKFEAGASYFQPEKVPSTPQRPRSQSNSRSRGRSPIKVQPVFGQPAMPSRTEEQTPIESPGGTKFSAEHWAETFKPQTFMPPPMPQRTGPSARKKSLRTTMGGNAAVVDDSETSDEKPLFTGPKKSASPSRPSSPVASPEPMDVDTPPIRNTVPQFTNGTNVNGNAEPLKRPAASASPVDTELKVAFDDLKVKDIISTLDMPVPPLTPTPPVTEKDVPTSAAYDDYLQRYEKYMAAWDLFNKKFLVHMVARKNQNDALQGMRWTDDQGLQIYRDGLKADQVVMQKWAEHMSVHEAAVKCFVIMKERMQSVEAAEARRPRKKTH